MSPNSAARRHAAKAVEALVQVMDDDDAPPAARVTAANAILDRAWGKPAAGEKVGREDGLADVSDECLDRIIASLKEEEARR